MTLSKMKFTKNIDKETEPVESRRKETGGGKLTIYDELTKVDGGLLIAGTTGAGKSTVIEGIIDSIITRHEPAAKAGKDGALLYLCDPKIIELRRFRFLPHVARYEYTHEGIVDLLREVTALMEDRYTAMAFRGLRQWDGARAYVVIDELADLLITSRKRIEPLLMRLLCLCRAAGIVIVMATQQPSRTNGTGKMANCCTARLALRCTDAIESRQIIGKPGAEKLPRYGAGILRSPTRPTGEAVVIPLPEDTQAIIDGYLRRKTTTGRSIT